jgi:hypothetical protein
VVEGDESGHCRPVPVGFGDNALLFATLALLKAEFYPDWSQPILQMVFVGAYILRPVCRADRRQLP